MLPLPTTTADFVNGAKKLISPWIQYLQQFTIAPPAFIDITPDGSPFEYQAEEPGNIFIDGATAIMLTRGTDTIDVSSLIMIPMGIKDIVEITYGVLPTVKFIPSYGQNTTS